MSRLFLSWWIGYELRYFNLLFTKGNCCSGEINHTLPLLISHSSELRIETNTFLRGGTSFTAVLFNWIVCWGITGGTLFRLGRGGLIISAGVYPRFELKPAATEVCWPATFTRNSWAISWDFCKMPKHCGLIPQLKVQNRYGVASNDAWKMRAVSKTRQRQRMLVKAMRRSLWRAGNHTGALSQRGWCDCSREQTKASSCPERNSTCVFQHTTHSSQRSIKSCVFSTTLNTPHAGIHQKNVPRSAHSRGVKNKLWRPKKATSTS